MKKITTLILFALIANSAAFAQAVLPTTYSWVGAYPTGWTAVDPTPSYYTAVSSAHTQPSLKMDATGDMVTINFSTTPGTLTYWLCVNGGSGTINGTYVVEESANGTTWTPIRTFVNNVTGAWTQYTDTPNAASRYVRFNYVSRSSGNVGLDDVTLTAGVSPNAEISIQQSGNTVVNGGTFTTASPVSTLSTITFSLLDLGLSALNVSNIAITGPAASDFVLGTYPSTVAASGSSTFNVDFTPSAAGTRNAVMTITSNDPLNSPYIVNLNGVGGTLATEPASQPSTFTYPIIKSYRLKVSFMAASGSPDGYLVLRSTSPIVDAPVDGVVYTRGDRINNAQVVYSANATSFMPNNIIANTTYYFAAFAYNGVGQYRNYLTASPLTGSVNSSASMQPTTYYNGISPTSSTFVTDLHNKINAHNIQFYSNYGNLMIGQFFARDTTNNQRVVTCSYSGLNKVYSEPWDWATNDFSREHTYCQSWQPTTNDANFQSRPEYNDYHMITPTNQNSVNALRSDYPLGEVVGAPTYTYLGCKMGNDINGNKVFEPRDADKGDAARCMLYQTVCYTGVAYTGTPNTIIQYGGSWSLPTYIRVAIAYGQDQNVLKRWNTQDPPDNFEIARNDYVDSLQGNRNPFIDSAQFICYIDFITMTHLSGVSAPCGSAGIMEVGNGNVDAIQFAPNPNNGNFMLNYTSNTNQKISLHLIDMLGRVVYSNEQKLSTGNNSIEMNIPSLSKGIYTFEFISETGKQTKKLVIE